MRIALTGATGFIGSRLALAAAALGHAVLAFGLANNGIEEDRRSRLAAEGIAVEALDLAGGPDPAPRLEGVDAVVHLAAAQHEVKKPDRHFEAVNVKGTIRLLDAAARAGVGRFVHASTIGVHGEGSGVLDEGTALRPDNVYGRTKLAGEEAVRAWRDRIQAVVVRVPETYGPGDLRLLKLFKGVQKGRFLVVGNGLNRHQPIYVDDLADALLACAVHPDAPGRTFVLGGPEAVTTNAMVAAVAAAVGREPPRVRAPLWPFLTAAYGFEWTFRPLGLDPPLHRRRMGFFTKDQAIRADLAREVLGFVPKVDFAEGARRTAAWYAERGLIEASGQVQDNTDYEKGASGGSA
ncbi:MAG: NAD-dependent epimerase/dehydratase family protein [Geminicoccaceae bacterium]|nr:NAD-dependent epimerase/dehydratase family protein [Geminicoccaceae bacterium]